MGSTQAGSVLTMGGVTAGVGCCCWGCWYTLKGGSAGSGCGLTEWAVGTLCSPEPAIWALSISLRVLCLFWMPEPVISFPQPLSEAPPVQSTNSLSMQLDLAAPDSWLARIDEESLLGSTTTTGSLGGGGCTTAGGGAGTSGEGGCTSTAGGGCGGGCTMTEGGGLYWRLVLAAASSYRSSLAKSMQAMKTSSSVSWQTKMSVSTNLRQLSWKAISTAKYFLRKSQVSRQGRYWSRLSQVPVSTMIDRMNATNTSSITWYTDSASSTEYFPLPSTPKNSMMSCLKVRSSQKAGSASSQNMKRKFSSLMISSTLPMYWLQLTFSDSKHSLRYWQQKMRMLACGSPSNAFTSRAGSCRLFSKNSGSRWASVKRGAPPGVANCSRLIQTIINYRQARHIRMLLFQAWKN